MTLLTALLATAFALVHLLIGRMTFLRVVPRSRWLSAAGGMAVAYVFLHLLPELGSHRRTFAEALGLREAAAEDWVHLVALTGLAAFYGLERMVKASRRGRGGADPAVAEDRRCPSSCIMPTTGPRLAATAR